MIKNANRATRPEESVEVRIAVLVTVMIAVIALLTEQLVGPVTVAAALVGIPLGYYASHRMRNADALGLKAVLALALAAAVGAFMVNVAGAVTAGFGAVQLALAELFLWVQIIHSAHVPARRDLVFSLASSGVMFAISSALSISLTVAPFLVLWLVGLVVSLVLAQRSAVRDAPQLAEPPPITRGMGRATVRNLAAVLGAALVVFAVLPPARSSRAISFPSNLAGNIPVPNPGGLSNPTLGDGGSGGGSAAQGGFDGRESFGYFGFAEELDTSLRGRPDETLVMRVRADAPAFWRGQTFDTWDGRTWTQSESEPISIGGSEPIALPRSPGDDAGRGDEFIQTYYLERGGPNIVFGAYRATQVYFPDRFLFMMPDGALRTGVQMDAGTVYTVISERPRVNADDLRAADPLRLGFPSELAPYLQVPESTPQRVLDLAAEVTANQATTYDKVRALEAWMGQNTTYTLDIPPLPEGADAVDHYLFDTKQGFCEQIGTSLVVMLRSQGIPARLVVGFTPGERNPFTGLYEVRASNAHSWAEVYFPGLGWQGFDPTAKVPLSGDFDPGTAGSGVGSYVAEHLTRALRAAPIAGSAVVGLAIIGALAVLGIQVHERRKRRRRASWTERLVSDIVDLGRRLGHPIERGETLRQYAERLEPHLHSEAGLGDVIASIEASRFGPAPEDPAARRRAEDTVAAIAEAHRRTRVPA